MQKCNTLLQHSSSLDAMDCKMWMFENTWQKKPWFWEALCIQGSVNCEWEHDLYIAYLENSEFIGRRTLSEREAQNTGWTPESFLQMKACIWRLLLSLVSDSEDWFCREETPFHHYWIVACLLNKFANYLQCMQCSLRTFLFSIILLL